MSGASTELEQALVEAVGREHVRTEADDLAYYGSDRCRGTWPVAPRAVVLPGSVAQVQAVVDICAAAAASIVPSGGRTGLAGAATATNGEIVVSLERMHRIIEVDPAARTLRCEAGTTVQAVQDAARALGLAYPVDFAAKGSAQVGGSIATNAGGVRVIRYGGTRSWVAGLRVVVASGEVLELGGALVKDNTGYDLRQLFIGSEGTLGIVVEATLRLTMPPRGAVVALCAMPDEPSILRLFARVQKAVLLQAFECFDHAGLQHVLVHHGDTRGPFADASPHYVLIEAEVEGVADAAAELTSDALSACLADAQDAGEIVDAVVAATAAQARELWSLREDLSESLHRHRPHKADVAVPVARVIEFAQAWRPLQQQHLPDAAAVVFGHVGDGNLHLNLLPPAGANAAEFTARCKAFDEHTYALVESFGGSISAEHGIGLLKRSHLHYSRGPGEIAMMRAIKAALDPNGLFNPGKIL